MPDELTGDTEDAPSDTPNGESRITPVIKAAAKHEFTPEDRTNAHRLVATAMVITFVTIAVSQNWWKHLRDFVSTKTHGPATKANPGG